MLSSWIFGTRCRHWCCRDPPKHLTIFFFFFLLNSTKLRNDTIKSAKNKKAYAAYVWILFWAKSIKFNMELFLLHIIVIILLITVSPRLINNFQRFTLFQSDEFMVFSFYMNQFVRMLVRIIKKIYSLFPLKYTCMFLLLFLLSFIFYLIFFFVFLWWFISGLHGIVGLEGDCLGTVGPINSSGQQQTPGRGTSTGVRRGPGRPRLRPAGPGNQGQRTSANNYNKRVPKPLQVPLRSNHLSNPTSNSTVSSNQNSLNFIPVISNVQKRSTSSAGLSESRPFGFYTSQQQQVPPQQQVPRFDD